MPLYQTYKINDTTQLLVWKITETFEELEHQVVLKNICADRLYNMKSELHRRAFLSVRMLMQHIGYTDHDMFYDEEGKPHLKDGNNISITHSYNFSAIIVSDMPIGIDMEIRREKIMKIAGKFLDKEFSYLNPDQITDYVRKLTVIWGVKEALYKMFSKSGLSFKQHINVHSFYMEKDNGTATVLYDTINDSYNFWFKEIEDFTLVYCIGNKTTQR
jgi:4'-phosphopantetheinyl transferase